MKPYFEALKAYIEKHPPNFGDGEFVLTMLYECYNENNPYDNEQIKTDFNELYQQMNGMPLLEMDKIIYPVCKLCRDHEKTGFVEGVRIGIKLSQELGISSESLLDRSITRPGNSSLFPGIPTIQTLQRFYQFI